jgi:hypothetical protein
VSSILYAFFGRIYNGVDDGKRVFSNCLGVASERGY